MFSGTHFLDVGESNGNWLPEQRRLDCPYCFEEFLSVEDLRLHKRFHRVNKQYGCKVCRANFVSLPGWKYHYRSHNSDLQNSCDNCNLKFKSFQSYVLHLENHKYCCSSCEKSFVKREKLRLHERKVHNIRNKAHGTKIFDEHRCPKCNEIFPTYSQLREHRKANSHCSPFVCSKCKEGFLSQVHLKSHTLFFKNCRKAAEKRKQKKFQELTPEIHIRRFDYSRVYVESNAYVCDNCESELPKEQLRREHWIGERQCCDHCDARFVNEKNYECLYCCETYSTDGQLQKHIEFVSEDLYICSKCMDTFGNKCTFGYHMMIDHGIDTNVDV